MKTKVIVHLMSEQMFFRHGVYYARILWCTASAWSISVPVGSAFTAHDLSRFIPGSFQLPYLRLPSRCTHRQRIVKSARLMDFDPGLPAGDGEGLIKHSCSRTRASDTVRGPRLHVSLYLETAPVSSGLTRRCERKIHAFRRMKRVRAQNESPYFFLFSADRSRSSAVSTVLRVNGWERV